MKQSFFTVAIVILLSVPTPARAKFKAGAARGGSRPAGEECTGEDGSAPRGRCRPAAPRVAGLAPADAT